MDLFFIYLVTASKGSERPGLETFLGQHLVSGREKLLKWWTIFFVDCWVADRETVAKKAKKKQTKPATTYEEINRITKREDQHLYNIVKIFTTASIQREPFTFSAIEFQIGANQIYT